MEVLTRRKYSEEDMKILKKVYIDYKQFERKLNRNAFCNKSIQDIYNFVYPYADRITNEDFKLGCFDFEYKNNCILTIDDYRHKGLFELSDLLEVLDNNGTICTITFDELEKLVLGYEE